MFAPMPFAPRVLALLALSLLPQSGWAQLRTAVVPADATVAIAPRGEAQPHLVTRSSLRATRVLRPWREESSGTGLRGIGYAIVPLAAAAVLAATLPGGGDGSAPSATTRTR